MKIASLIFLILLALPFFVSLNDSSLWDANEAFYAQTPREMVEHGNWLIPHFNGNPRVNKPPLSYWIVAVLYKTFGVSVFWERFPMALLAYGSVIVVFFIGRMLFEESVALWGAGIFATTIQFLLLSRRLFIDILMLFWLLMAVAAFLSWLKGGKRWNFLLFCFFLGLAFMAKGPVAFLPVLFLGVYLALSGKLSSLRQAPWIWGSFILLLTCVLPFLLLDWETGTRVARDFVFKENISRFSHVSFGPRRGLFYYVGIFLVQFFPWAFFFIAAAIAWAREERHLASTDRRQAVHLLLVWVGVIFVVFSLSYNKQEYYILPLYPAAALFVADYLHRGRPPRMVLWGVGILLIFLGVLVYQFALMMFPGTKWLWVPLLALPVILFSLVRKAWRIMIPALAIFYFAILALYLKPFEQYKPVHFFAQTIQAHVLSRGSEKTFVAGYYRFTAPSLAFYLNRPILELFDQEEAVRYLKSEMPVYLIVDAADLPDLERAAAIPLQIVEVRPKLYTNSRTLIEGFKRGKIGNLRNAWTRPIYLITNQRPG